MNAFEVLKTTTNPGYWVCTQCRQPHDKKSEANECCLRDDEVLRLRERERFEKAKKIQWDKDYSTAILLENGGAQ